MEKSSAKKSSEDKMKKKEPLDEIFGIWKDMGITLKKLRKQAWERKPGAKKTQIVYKPKKK